MRLSRKIIWGSVLLLIGVVVLFSVLMGQKSAQFSVSGQDAPVIQQREYQQRYYRYPEFSSKGVSVSEKGATSGGLTMKAVLPFLQSELRSVFAIRSATDLYPDGTCAQYEVLYSANEKVFRLLVGKDGVISTTPTSGAPAAATLFPVNFPDSSDAILQVTANPYFANAKIVGIALYFEERDGRWSYIVRTSMGDVSILIPGEGAKYKRDK
ncbi:MAG TPA: hypothetical protein VJ579_01230 [Candidatus Paceibacterota bacterium]|nr:hypothetical protein [Candidatus Paceibacterota bacterium]